MKTKQLNFAPLIELMDTRQEINDPQKLALILRTSSRLLIELVNSDEAAIMFNEIRDSFTLINAIADSIELIQVID